MNDDQRMKVLKEAQNLRNHIENTMLVVENDKDKAVETHLCMLWADIESLIEYVLD